MMSPKCLNILLAVDGSDHAQAAARLVRDLPLLPRSRVTALGVLTLRNYLYTPGRTALLEALDQAEALLQGCGAEVHTGLRQGNPAEELCSYAEEHRPDLIVLGAKGQRAALGLLLGGVAQQIIEYARQPVLVVRAPYLGLRRVLLAVDGSAHSQQAAHYLTRFPLPSGAEVRAMLVLPPALQPAWLLSSGKEGEAMSYETAERRTAGLNEAEASAGQAALSQAKSLLRAHGIAAGGVLVRGDPAGEISAYAGAHEIDLIVAGSRGLTGVRGWLLGSVSRKLVHSAPCAVLIVRETEVVAVEPEQSRAEALGA